MNPPASLYEAIVRGFAGTGDIQGRRALFLFVIDHSEAMQRTFPETGRSRLSSVIDTLNEMKQEMHRVDDGDHLDLGFLGYPLENASSQTGPMWTGDDPTTIVRPVSSADTLRERAALPLVNGACTEALAAAASCVAAWRGRNRQPIFEPIVIHVLPAERAEVSGVALAARRITDDAGALLFHCCFDENCRGNVVIPASGSVPAGIARQLYDLTSDMPEVIRDVAELLQGRMPSRFRQAVEEMAADHGIPTGLASMGVDLLGRAMGDGLRLPTGRPGWTQRVSARVEGLTIEGRKGFALLKGMVGFRIVTKLLN
jgi:hypothetical protein